MHMSSCSVCVSLVRLGHHDEQTALPQKDEVHRLVPYPKIQGADLPAFSSHCCFVLSDKQ